MAPSTRGMGMGHLGIRCGEVEWLGIGGGLGLDGFKAKVETGS